MNDRARILRKNATEAEQRLWHFLRDRRMAGYKFRRQHAVGPFVVDFACSECRLVVEADGGQHAEQISHDQRRTAFLEAQGFRVLRFWNDEILADTDAVLESIRLALIGAPSPQPSPPIPGERETELEMAGAPTVQPSPPIPGETGTRCSAIPTPKTQPSPAIPGERGATSALAVWPENQPPIPGERGTEAKPLQQRNFPAASAMSEEKGIAAMATSCAVIGDEMQRPGTRKGPSFRKAGMTSCGRPPGT